MSATLPSRDERTLVVENASFRWAYLVHAFGLLAIVAYRGFVRAESSWDLLALVLAGGAVVGAYQAAHRVVNRRWLLVSAAATAAALVLAAVLAWSGRH